MSKIQVLDQITIDQIAAGEVIERPASVVKELVENAIDAGSSSVTVEIQEGGIALIRIADNGCGIAREDVPNAFLRHSTSKIRSIQDLSHVGSLGFRGEALSSIAAVSQVELRTKTADDLFGTHYLIEGGTEKKIEEIGATDGTTFLIRQLFYNIPARRKFLKTPMTEASHVNDVLMRLALSHPEIALRFVNNGQEKLRTSGNGKTKDVIYQLYGRDVAANLLEIHYEKNGIRLDGFLGKPIISRGNRTYENYFINGRYIRSGMVSKAIEDGYKDFMMQHKFPFVVLYLSLPPEETDVNVHPTKMEVRFHNQQAVYGTLMEGVHKTLSEPELIPDVHLEERNVGKKSDNSTQHNVIQQQTPEITQNNVNKPVETVDNIAKKDEDYFIQKMRERVLSHYQQKPFTPVQDQERGAEESSEESRRTRMQPSMQPDCVREESSYRTDTVEKNLSDSGCRNTSENLPKNFSEDTPSQISSQSASESLDSQAAPKPRWEEVLTQSQGRQRQGVVSTETEEVTSSENEVKANNEQLNLFEERFLDPKEEPDYQIIGQVFDTYWIVQFKESMYIIDQHAAHERVLYERTLAEMKNREYTSQMISPPIVLSLTMQEEEILNRHMDRFERIGFEIEPFGGNEYAVRAVPDNLFSIAKKELLLEMLDDMADGLNSSMTPDLIDEKIASMSCKAAVKGNQRLSAAEVQTLIKELLTLENPYHCPHGRPTIVSMSKRELEKKFKRIV